VTQPPHDPHLAAALRHAPDADQAPPPALSRAILRAADEAARRPSAAGAAAPLSTPLRQRWLERLQRWLQAPRLAGGAAALMLAVLIGSLWGPAPDTSPVPQRATLPEPAATPKAEAPAATGASAGEAAPVAADATQKAARPFTSPPPAATRRSSPATPAAPQRRAAVAEPVAAAPQAAAAPAAPQPLSNAAPETASAAATMAQSVAEPPSLARMHRAAVADEGAAAATAAAQRRAEANGPQLAFAPAASPWRAWLLLLSHAAAGRWVRQPAGAAPADAPVWSVGWPPGDAPQATVSLHGRTLWWREADGGLWSAGLAPDAALPAPPEPAASAAR
jgi:hypothetical protein